MSKSPLAIKNLPIDGLRMFSVLADLKSISRTAKVISRSQPAVSLQLKKLEENLDTTLFLRHKGHLSLTGDGKILLHYAEQILALNDSLLNELSYHEKRQVIRVGIPNDLAERIWSIILLQFREMHPHIHFEIYEDSSIKLIAMLEDDLLDLAIAFSMTAGEKYCIHEVKKPLFWVGNSALIKQRPLALIASFKGCNYRAAMEETLKQADIPYCINVTSNNFYTIHDALERRMGVTALLANEKNRQTFIDKQLTQLPELPKLSLGLHVKSEKMSEELNILTQYIRPLM